jgi:hypothetical protein
MMVRIVEGRGWERGGGRWKCFFERKDSSGLERYLDGWEKGSESVGWLPQK